MIDPAGVCLAAMTLLHAIAIFAAGIVAGTINTVVGSGTLFTFPVLLAFGYAPVVANVSNTVGLVPGSAPWPSAIVASWPGSAPRLRPPGLASVGGGSSARCCCSACRPPPLRRSCRRSS